MLPVLIQHIHSADARYDTILLILNTGNINITLTHYSEDSEMVVD
jgi:hypothetical protein